MSKKRILLIEDDKDIRDTITFALQGDYEITSSDNARILKNLSEIDPHLILLDNWLTDWKSDANGQQLSKEIKSNPATSHYPVVIVSAVSNIKETADAGLSDGYLKKPFELKELEAIVKKHIR
ncbi:response regulator [Mucilaginibacter ginkgonis]|uniref:Response regulator n=1 Tax=Mucilaginibacter ginkgonis TaxID=2682091 RepID=A0A6I4HUS1_9SPHI|nr:response regulator [Mucilaginibacter ginkgonis]QQL50116.1 response regulator [Mucilaginibacter ginkgonis]